MSFPHSPPHARKRRRAVAALLALPLALVALAPAHRAQAQLLRSFPENARPGRLEMRIFPEAVLDGKPVRLAAGARIYDTDNRIVMPASLSGTHEVLVDEDASGSIARIWLPTSEELAAARERENERKKERKKERRQNR